jgi:glutamate synthase (NADPH/NADH) small chain
MPAYAHEVYLALSHGTDLIYHAVPKGLAISAEGQLLGVDLQVQSPDGRFAQPLRSARLEATHVVRATGQGGAALVSELPVRSVRGVVQVDSWGRTSHRQYFAGGDCVSGGQEVVNAVEAGKRAAQAMVADLLAQLGPAAGVTAAPSLAGS